MELCNKSGQTYVFAIYCTEKYCIETIPHPLAIPGNASFCSCACFRLHPFKRRIEVSSTLRFSSPNALTIKAYTFTTRSTNGDPAEEFTFSKTLPIRRNGTVSAPSLIPQHQKRSAKEPTLTPLCLGMPKKSCSPSKGRRTATRRSTKSESTAQACGKSPISITTALHFYGMFERRIFV